MKKVKENKVMRKTKFKTIKHLNLISYNQVQGNNNLQYFHFPCRGCTMLNRDEIWQGYIGSVIHDSTNREIDNSYLTLEEEPTNPYDKDAIMVVCRGEFFGTVGYVGREFTKEVKRILDECYEYRIDMIDGKESVQREIELVMTYSIE